MPELPSPDPEARYRVLLTLSQEISRTLDLQDILDHLISALQSVMAYDAAGVFVLNRSVPLGGSRSPNLIAGMASVGFGDRPRTDDPMLRSGRGIVGHVIQTGERVLAPDVRQDPHYVAGRESTLSELAVPIVSNGVVIGALNVESDQLAAFTLADAGWLESFAVAAALSIEKAMLHRQVLEKQRLDQQLSLARDVQASLLPARAPQVEGYDLAGINVPSWEIGGDYYDFVPLDDGRIGLVVADVAGKGVAAALIMATFRAALRTLLRRGGDIPGLVTELDRLLLESMDSSRFVTAVYGILEPATGTFGYVNCGHNPPLLLRSGGRRELLESSRPALGLRGRWTVHPGTAWLGPGDVLVLYTDGVVELNDAEEQEFGTDRLEAVVREHATRPAQDIVGAVVDQTRMYAERSAFDDDFTLVVVKRAWR